MEYINEEHRLRDALETIIGIGLDYDGFDTSNAQDMKSLVDDFMDIAKMALRGEDIWVDGSK